MIVLFEMTSKIAEKSELTEESALKIAKGIKRRIRERHDYHWYKSDNFSFKILDLQLKGVEILTPDYTLEDIKEHKDEILKASKLSEKDFDFIIDVYKDAEKLAKEIAKEFDIDDFPLHSPIFKTEHSNLD